MYDYNKDMKLIAKFIFISTISSIFSTSVFAAKYLKCLGAEEAIIHTKSIGGAYKKLNQRVLGELVQLGENVVLDKAIEEKLCDGSIPFPSVYLLEKLFTEKKFIFKSLAPKSKKSLRVSELRSINHLKVQSFELFIQFLSDLQAEVQVPNCLVKIYPPLKRFYEQAQYLMVETGPRKILAQFPKMPLFFEKLRSPKWKLSCLKTR